MSTRKIKDAKDLSTNELIYFKGHAKATYMSDGRNVEEAIRQISTGGGGGGSVYKWVWNTEMTGTFTEEEFENLSNADVVYLTTGVAGMEVLYSVDARFVVEDALHLGAHYLSFETDTDNSKVAYYVESIAFVFDNSSKTWSVQGGNAELITNEQLASALEGKQDIIEDLEKIRQGAAKGNTALQKDTFFMWEVPIDDDGVPMMSGELTEEEYNKFKNSEVVFLEGVAAVREGDTLVASFGQNILILNIGILEGVCYYAADIIEIPTKTSQLENDSNFVSSDNLRTINGQSIVGSGDIEIGDKLLSVDNVYITDFKVVDFEYLKAGEIESLQIDSAALSEAIIAKKTILVPYDDGYVGGYGLLLGEVADTEIYFSIYTHFGQYIFAESYDGVVNAHVMIIRNLQMESVQQTSLDTLKNIANANAVQTDGLLYAFPDQATGDEDDVLLSRGKVKTINGQTIMHDEDSDDIITTYKRTTTNLSSVELLPNSVIEWAGPVLSQELVLTFGEQPPQGYAVEYIAKFNVGADGVQLIVPDNVVWADGVYPAMTNGKTYEISFVDNLATFLEF